MVVQYGRVDCMQVEHHYGSDIYHNICANTVSEVPWGGADWAWAIATHVLVVLVLVAALTCLLGLVLGLVRDIFDD